MIRQLDDSEATRHKARRFQSGCTKRFNNPGYAKQLRQRNETGRAVA